MYLQPAFDGIHCVLLVLLPLSWQVQKASKTGKFRGEHLRRVRFRPENDMIVLAVPISVLNYNLRLPYPAKATEDNWPFDRCCSLLREHITELLENILAIGEEWVLPVRNFPHRCQFGFFYYRKSWQGVGSSFACIIWTSGRLCCV